MAKTVKEIMLSALQAADLSASQIMGHVERAHAYTELANACAAVISCRDWDKDTSGPLMKDQPEEKSAKKTSSTPQIKIEVPKEVKVEEPVEKPVVVAVAPEEKKLPEEKIVKEKPVEEKVAEKPAAEEFPKQEKPILTEKWTPEAREFLSAEMKIFSDFIKKVKTEQGEQALSDIISLATDGHATVPREVTPLTLKLVVQYIQQLEK